MAQNKTNFKIFGRNFSLALLLNYTRNPRFIEKISKIPIEVKIVQNLVYDLGYDIEKTIDRPWILGDFSDAFFSMKYSEYEDSRPQN